MKKRYYKILVILAIIIIAWISGSFIITYKLTHRASAKYVEQSPPDSMNDIFKKIKIGTTDSLNINGIMASRDSNEIFVLLLHGKGGDYSSNYELMDSIYNHNINSLAISLRCHGSSDGSLNDIGFSARYDVIAVVNYIKDISDDAKIIIAGRSLGSAAAIFAYEEIKKDVAGFLLESPYYDLEKAVGYRLENYLPDLISDIAIINLSLFARVFIPKIEMISPFNYSKKMNGFKDVIFLAGEKDVRAPLADIESISNNIMDSKVIVFNGARHQSLFLYNRNKYLKIVLDLCRQ